LVSPFRLVKASCVPGPVEWVVSSHKNGLSIGTLLDGEIVFHVQDQAGGQLLTEDPTKRPLVLVLSSEARQQTNRMWERFELLPHRFSRHCGQFTRLIIGVLGQPHQRLTRPRHLEQYRDPA
jgi:hypothetical protein